MEWRKAQACGNSNCVEVNIWPISVFVRDFKNPYSSYLAFTHEEWAAFLAGVKAGEFDSPSP